MTSETVLSYFKEITAIPRESGHEEQIIAYLQKFAADNGLECKTDEAGNVLIVKEEAPGYENVPTIVLQSHSDMVCEKNEGVEHDFAKDPIQPSLMMYLIGSLAKSCSTPSFFSQTMSEWL